MLNNQLGRGYTVAQEKGETNTGEILYTNNNNKKLIHTHISWYRKSKYMDH